MGLGRQAQGAHFISHTFATMCLDWSICALLSICFFPQNFEKTSRKISSAVFSLFFAAYLAICLNQPFFFLAFQSLPFSISDLWLITVFGLLFVAAVYFTLQQLYFPLLIKFASLVFSLIAATAFYYNYNYGTIINTDMMNNILATDYAEARELISVSAFTEISFLLFPAVCSCFYFVIKKASVLSFSLSSGVSLIALVSLIGLNFQGIASYIRSEPISRNLISPANVIGSAARAIFSSPRASEKRVRKIVDPAPKLVDFDQRKKGVLFVVVVGETARLANWGLNGYHRDTTPQLKNRGVFSFDKTTSCGTSTEVSLPCMFSRIGRRDYDRKRILREESLLPLLQRAGVNVYWIDNQSGSKGVSDGVENLKIQKKEIGALCSGSRCYDEALLAGLNVHKVINPKQVNVIFMHQIGSHGPAYFRRYPPEFEKFKPACKNEKLQNCSKESIINAYDNSILYSDHFLSGVIDWLKGLTGMDTGLLYVSDHGESLGENNLYLHGAPEFIAPSVQKEVPMFLWLSNGLEKRIGLDKACFKEETGKEKSHDNIYSSLLGILGVESKTYDKELDFSYRCRKL